MAGVDFGGKDITGASLLGTKFGGALNLASCTFDNLRGAILDGCDMAGVDLRGKDLAGAKFGRALNLASCTFDNLKGAILSGCDLSGVDLSGVDLTEPEGSNRSCSAPVGGSTTLVRLFGKLKHCPYSTM